MKTLSICLALLTTSPLLPAQDTKTSAAAGRENTSKAEKPKPTTEELENKFIATLSNATMSGRWCSIKDGVMGPEKEDKYTIVSVKKVSGDNWIINARVQYNKTDIIAPIPVQVKWAGDAPVIIVDKVPMPGGSVYNARVMIFDHTYAGTWSGGKHTGLLNGLITNDQKEKPAESK